jgi:predicted nucleic acid-binding protein
MKLPDVNIWLAAFAKVSGFEMVTTDKAFKQFKGLQIGLIEIGK